METLADLAACPESLDTLVIVVVNNRHPDAASAEDISLNRQTLEALQKWDSNRLRVTWVDASSPGLELPEKEGVGLARKLGLDAGLQILADLDQLQTPLVCLDGDTRVDDDYLPALHRFFESPDRWAAILSYAHPIEGDPQQQAAIHASFVAVFDDFCLGANRLRRGTGDSIGTLALQSAPGVESTLRRGPWRTKLIKEASSPSR